MKGLHLLPLALAAAVGLAAQGPAPVFRSGVTYVEVDVRVTDERGDFVRGLTRDDFELLEDGQPQSIAAFDRIDLPVEPEPDGLPGRRATPAPDVSSNVRPFAGRVYVMVIDDTHTRFSRSGLARRAARAFIEKRLGANDVMAVVHTAGPRDANQELTGDKVRLLAAVDRTTGRALRSATAARIDRHNMTADVQLKAGAVVAAPEPSGDGSAAPGGDVDPDGTLRLQGALDTLDTLRAVAEWLSVVRERRKAILFVSEGLDYDFTDVSGGSTALVLSAMRAAQAAAARANVVFYGIDPRGLTMLADDEIEMGASPLTEDPSLSITRGLADELRRSQRSLQAISEETGGFAVIDDNGFDGAFERIVRENSSYYVLAYDPPGHEPDGKYHKLEVRVKRPGLKVTHRRGYASPRGKPKDSDEPSGNPSIHAALGSSLPISGLGLTVFAAPFRAASGEGASVLIGTEVAGGDLSLAAAGPLEISSLAVDARGEVRGGTTETVSFPVGPESRERIRRGGLRVLSRFRLPPGRHQLRVAAHDAGNGRVGSVVMDLTVPDFHREPLSISGIAIGSSIAQAMSTARPDPELGQALPTAPVASREFPRNDQAVAYAEVYDNEVEPHTLDVTTTVTRLEDGRVALSRSEEQASSSLRDRRIAVTVTLPVAELAAGTYVLKVATRTRTGSASAERVVPFSVVGRRAAAAGDPPVPAPLELARMYAAGQRGQALARLAGWDAEDFRRDWDGLRELRSARAGLLPEAELRAVILLHTDRAALEREQLPRVAREGACDDHPHRAYARSLASVLMAQSPRAPEHERTRDFVRRWTTAMALDAQRYGCFAAVRSWTEQGAEWFPADAVFLLLRATAVETEARLAGQAHFGRP
ncbi:MAG: VWA domain-containing protein, partial [Vicinamibacteria bacterium]|nr:VWA domain-containing protein [Vicinamibacteria bacterium]